MIYTWWVEFSWTYDVQDPETGNWYEDSDFEAMRFKCLKKEIPLRVKAYVEQELEEENYSNLKIKITDKYITTDCEV